MHTRHTPLSKEELATVICLSGGAVEIDNTKSDAEEIIDRMLVDGTHLEIIFAATGVFRGYRVIKDFLICGAGMSPKIFTEGSHVGHSNLRSVIELRLAILRTNYPSCR